MALSRAVVDADKQTRRLEFKELIRRYLASQDPGPKIIEHLKSILPPKATISAYRAKASEVSIEGLFYEKNHKWVFPKIENDDLRFLAPKSMERFIEGPFGILEPDPNTSEEIAISDIDIALVPGIAFDREGNRLGKGRGFFDRALRDFNGLKIGIGTRVQVADERLPSSELDVPMDVIVTDDFVLRFFAD